MKNIFVLPSKSVSKLYFYRGNFALSKKGTYGTPEITPHNIYITNSEDIKEGDYGIGHATGLFGVGEKDYLFKHDGSKKGRINSICVGAKKIVLCTDPELIKNGVQEVPEYFLKWFIVGKNPIEYVEIKPHLESLDTMKNSYEIIIPQPKQETIEEVAERILANNIDGLKDLLNDDDLFYFYKGVIINYGVAVAEHQSEKTFSEEDMRNSFCNGYRANVKSSLNDSFQDWLNKFKK